MFLLKYPRFLCIYPSVRDHSPNETFSYEEETKLATAHGGIGDASLVIVTPIPLRVGWWGGGTDLCTGTELSLGVTNSL